jgi:hypothetical protein
MHSLIQIKPLDFKLEEKKKIFIMNIDSTKCLACKNLKEGINIQCPNKRKIGNFCGKHRTYIREGLKPINERGFVSSKLNIVILDNVDNVDNIPKKTILIKKKGEITYDDYKTNPHLPYSTSTIRKSCKFYKLYNLSECKEIKINKLKMRLIRFFNIFSDCIKNMDKVITLQKYVKKWINTSKILQHGPALFQRGMCNNVTDFYNLDDLKDVPNKYFFSYRDSDNFIYGFHIESIIELINESSTTRNPYNRMLIPKTIQTRAKEIWSILTISKQASNNIQHAEYSDIKLRTRSKCLTTFQKIDLLGYQTNINWIINISLNRVKNLYRHILNYWHYKAGFTQETKNGILGGLESPFTDYQSRHVSNQLNKYVVMEIILDILDKLVSNGFTNDDKNQASIMILMAIGEINRECIEMNPWLG